jgi:Flp pilus assembly protein TadG
MTTATRPAARPGWGGRRLAGRWARLIEAGDRGSATIEITLATPVLVGILLFVVLCGRLVSVQLDVDAAAHAAARAASLSRTVPAALIQARTMATQTLDQRHVSCPHPALRIDTDNLTPGGTVSVTIACTVPLADLVGVVVPGSRHVSATAVSPIDVWRGISAGFSNPDTGTGSRWRP